MTLKIISAQEILYTGQVSKVTLPGAMGEFTVLHNHAALMAVLDAGTVRFTAEDGSEQSREISGGIADIASNVINVCVY